uniref:CSON002502 protein n=1 Tax=Culicoides sonorensis TaxID=179676 RepID=A0A336L3J2_CULSO
MKMTRNFHLNQITVCFGPVRVVVPCGNGEMLVRELVHESIRRYKKASGKIPSLNEALGPLIRNKKKISIKNIFLLKITK